jgi:hypothetical protein
VVAPGELDKGGIRRPIDRNFEVCKRAARYRVHPIFEPTVRQQFRRLWRGGDHSETAANEAARKRGGIDISYPYLNATKINCT